MVMCSGALPNCLFLVQRRLDHVVFWSKDWIPVHFVFFFNLRVEGVVLTDNYI